MGRPKGSKNRTKRKAPKSAYETYEYWYKKYTKGKKKSLFRDKLTESEFNDKYARLKQLDKQQGIKPVNVARRVAMAQERISREGERKARELYGEIPDLTTEADREAFFTRFYNDMKNQDRNLTHDDIEEEFREYFY